MVGLEASKNCTDQIMKLEYSCLMFLNRVLDIQNWKMIIQISHELMNIQNMIYSSSWIFTQPHLSRKIFKLKCWRVHHEYSNWKTCMSSWIFKLQPHYGLMNIQISNSLWAHEYSNFNLIIWAHKYSNLNPQLSWALEYSNWNVWFMKIMETVLFNIVNRSWMHPIVIRSDTRAWKLHLFDWSVLIFRFAHTSGLSTVQHVHIDQMSYCRSSVRTVLETKINIDVN